MCLGHNYRTGNGKQELYHVLDEVTEGWSKCFLFSSLTSAPIIRDVPTPLLPPSSLLMPPGALPQNPDFVFIYHALHANREEGFGLPPVQILILHHLSLERFPSRAEMPPLLVCILNWFSFPELPNLTVSLASHQRLQAGAGPQAFGAV